MYACGYLDVNTSALLANVVRLLRNRLEPYVRSVAQMEVALHCEKPSDGSAPTLRRFDPRRGCDPCFVEGAPRWPDRFYRRLRQQSGFGSLRIAPGPQRIAPGARKERLARDVTPGRDRCLVDREKELLVHGPLTLVAWLESDGLTMRVVYRVKSRLWANVPARTFHKGSGEEMPEWSGREPRARLTRACSSADTENWRFCVVRKTVGQLVYLPQIRILDRSNPLQAATNPNILR
jgi:hypothetical protein